MDAVLSGVRVLDFGRYIAGPWCAALLGDLGADVIRVDKIGGSEDRDVLPVGDGLDGALYLQINRNKRSMTLAASGEERDEVLRRLVEGADVVVANLPDAALTALGLDYTQLTAIKPDIILTTMSAFGHEGPFAEKIGFDVVAQAMSGAMHLTGHRGEPMRSTVSWVDYNTATLCAYGTMAALMERLKSGRGQHVRGSLLATAVTASNGYLIEQALTGVGRGGTGNRGQVAAPADMFRMKDGHIVMQAIGGSMFRRWARLVGAEHLIEDDRFATDESRAEHSEYISGLMQDWCNDKTVAEALEALEAARVPGAQVLDTQQVLDHPQVRESGILTEIGCGPGDVAVPVASTPVSLSRTPGTVRTGAPANGQHTAEILAELGFDDEAIARLQTDGVV